MAPRILVIDDDPETTGALCRILTKDGFVTRAANDSRTVLQTSRDFQPHLVLLDYDMPHLHGGDVAWQLWSNAKLRETKLIICSAFPLEEFRTQLPPRRIPFLSKPVDAADLLRLIHETLNDVAV